MKEEKSKGRKSPRRASGKKNTEDPQANEIVLPGGAPPGDPMRGDKQGRSRPAGERPIGYQEEGPTGQDGKTGPDPPSDDVFRDIVKKAREGNIKYQELYLKYIDLISQKTADGDEVIYEATFIDDKDKET